MVLLISGRSLEAQSYHAIRLGGLEGTSSSFATGINNLGRVVGSAYVVVNLKPEMQSYSYSAFRATLFSGSGFNNLDLGMVTMADFG